MSTLKRTGSTAAWRTIREHIIRRDLGLCQLCGNEGTEVDHKLERRDGGTDEPDNLWLLCTTCHRAKTIKRSQTAPKPLFSSNTTPHDPTCCFPSPTRRVAPLSPFEAP